MARSSLRGLPHAPQSQPCFLTTTSLLRSSYSPAVTLFFFLVSKSGSRPSWSRCCFLCLLLLLPTTSVLKRREMLAPSIAAVVLGCFYFCPLDCDASGMVVDCAAVWKNKIKRLQRNTCSSCFFGLGDVMVGGRIASYVFIFIFWSRCCWCCRLLLLLLPTTSVPKPREMLARSDSPQSRGPCPRAGPPSPRPSRSASEVARSRHRVLPHAPYVFARTPVPIYCLLLLLSGLLPYLLPSNRLIILYSYHYTYHVLLVLRSKIYQV